MGLWIASRTGPDNVIFPGGFHGFPSAGKLFMQDETVTGFHMMRFTAIFGDDGFSLNDAAVFPVVFRIPEMPFPRRGFPDTGT